VAAGLGVAIVPESIQSLRHKQVTYRRLGRQEMTEMGLAYERENHSPALRSLLDVAANIREPERLR